MRLVLQTVKVLVSELATNSNCLQHVSLVTTLLVVVVAAMDFYAKQMAFTMGNAFLKTRVSHTGVTMLPTVTDKPESFRCGYCINWHTTVPPTDC